MDEIQKKYFTYEETADGGYVIELSYFCEKKRQRKWLKLKAEQVAEILQEVSCLEKMINISYLIKQNS